MITIPRIRELALDGFKVGYAACRPTGSPPAIGGLMGPHDDATERMAWLEGFKHGGDLAQRHWAQYEDCIDVINNTGRGG